MDVKRRTFLANSALLAGALPIIPFMKYLPMYTGLSNKKIEIFNTNWGFEGDLSAFCKMSKQAGYDGIELWVPQDSKKRMELIRMAEDNGLKLGLLAGNSGKTVDEHFDSFKVSIGKALECQPAFINCHSGKDYFSFDENAPFIRHTIEQEKISGVPIHHETHRGRILFSAPTAKAFMTAFPELHLTLDISHWTVVHESLLADQKETIDLALSRTRHIHSRVGFQEAPQIPNPSSEHYESAIQAHFSWWDQIVNAKAEAGETLTMTTEFGPPPYMWTSPETGEPLEQVWDMNILMLKMWKERYA